MSTPGEPAPGWCSPEVRQELPGLRLLELELELQPGISFAGDSPAAIVERLKEHSNRLRGRRAIAMRAEPIPAAYRAFYRQIGLDPDVQRTHLEQAIFERIARGGFATAGLLHDVLLIVLIDTAVPVWALDASTLDGPLGIRSDLEGRLVLADARRTLAPLFADPPASHAPGPETSRLRLFALQVPGVPALYVEEALWSCGSALLSI